MSRLFMPSLYGNAEVEGQTGLPCGMNQQAALFASWWMHYLGERAKLMSCDERLVRAAQKQADWLSLNDFEEGDPHVGEGGSTANQRVRIEGFPLPEWHKDGNTVESAAHSWDDLPELVADLMAHDTHHDHLWGLKFYKDSVFYGVGVTDTYFVVVSAPKE